MMNEPNTHVANININWLELNPSPSAVAELSISDLLRIFIFSGSESDVVLSFSGILNFAFVSAPNGVTPRDKAADSAAS